MHRASTPPLFTPEVLPTPPRPSSCPPCSPGDEAVTPSPLTPPPESPPLTPVRYEEHPPSPFFAPHPFGGGYVYTPPPHPLVMQHFSPWGPVPYHVSPFMLPPAPVSPSVPFPCLEAEILGLLREEQDARIALMQGWERVVGQVLGWEVTWRGFIKEECGGRVGVMHAEQAAFVAITDLQRLGGAERVARSTIELQEVSHILDLSHYQHTRYNHLSRKNSHASLRKRLSYESQLLSTPPLHSLVGTECSARAGVVFSAASALTEAQRVFYEKIIKSLEGKVARVQNELETEKRNSAKVKELAANCPVEMKLRDFEAEKVLSDALHAKQVNDLESELAEVRECLRVKECEVGKLGSESNKLRKQQSESARVAAQQQSKYRCDLQNVVSELDEAANSKKEAAVKLQREMEQRKSLEKEAVKLREVSRTMTYRDAELQELRKLRSVYEAGEKQSMRDQTEHRKLVAELQSTRTDLRAAQCQIAQMYEHKLSARATIEKVTASLACATGTCVELLTKAEQATRQDTCREERFRYSDIALQYQLCTRLLMH